MSQTTTPFNDDVPQWVSSALTVKPLRPLTEKILAHKKLGPIAQKLLGREILTYLAAGVATTIFSFLMFELFIFTGIGIVATNVISSILAIIFAFAVNKHFVFLSRDWSIKRMAPELVKFSGGRLIVMFAETGLLYLLVDMWGLNETICKIFTLVMVVVVNYIISKLIF
jgi:putative flippase GtrA